MKILDPEPASALRSSIQRYIDYKNALGVGFHTESRGLRLLLRFLHAHGVRRLADVSSRDLRNFFRSIGHRKASAFNDLLYTTRGMFSWFCLQEDLSENPLSVEPREPSAHRIPFIFNDRQSRDLIRLAAALPDGRRLKDRGFMFSNYFAALRGLGLRLMEGVNARLSDVDLDRNALHIRRTKFGKSRWVPFGPRMRRRLIRVIEHRQASGANGEAYLFSCTDGRPLSATSIHRVFGGLLLPKLGLLGGPIRPRIHDLRHTFAVACVTAWARAGLPVNALLELLSVYLGHSSLKSTSVYLHVTPELQRRAARGFHEYSARALEVLGRRP